MRAILTYHSIDSSGSPISIDAEVFRRHVDWLRSGTVRTLALDDLLRAPAEENSVAVTFDDGFVNFQDNAWPLLRDGEIPVTLFVATDHVGGTNDWGGSARAVPRLPLLDWDSLARLAEEGLTVGSHSRSHRDLCLLDGAVLREEMLGSAERIQSTIGCRPEAFCYPFGRVSSAIVEVARETYSLACTTELRPLRTLEDPLRLPRLDVYYLRRTAWLQLWGERRLLGYLTLRSCARRIRQALEARARNVPSAP